MREGHLSDQLTQHETQVDAEFKRQAESREEKFRVLRDMLESHITLRDQTTERFQFLFNHEISKLHNQLQTEIEVLFNLFINAYN